MKSCCHSPNANIVLSRKNVCKTCILESKLESKDQGKNQCQHICLLKRTFQSRKRARSTSAFRGKAFRPTSAGLNGARSMVWQSPTYANEKSRQGSNQKMFSCSVKKNLPEGPHRHREGCLEDPAIHEMWSFKSTKTKSRRKYNF